MQLYETDEGSHFQGKASNQVFAATLFSQGQDGATTSTERDQHEAKILDFSEALAPFILMYLDVCPSPPPLRASARPSTQAGSGTAQRRAGPGASVLTSDGETTKDWSISMIGVAVMSYHRDEGAGGAVGMQTSEGRVRVFLVGMSQEIAGLEMACFG